MIRKLSILLLAMITSANVFSQEDDKFLGILQRELNREVTEFARLPQPPYFISYRVNDDEQVLIGSSFGSLTQSFSNRERALNVRVRVGDYLVDNTHPISEDGMMGQEFGGFESGSLPLDDVEDAIRYSLWSATDDRYRDALILYSAVKNAQSSKKEEKLPADFSKEPVEKYYEAPGPPLTSLYRKEQWEQKTRDYSKVFLGDASIVSADVMFSISRERRYYVSSEGASVVQNFTSAYINVSASVRATDGEIVPLHQSCITLPRPPTFLRWNGDQRHQGDDGHIRN